MTSPLSALISANDVDVDDLGEVLTTLKASSCEPVASLVIDGNFVNYLTSATDSE